MTIQQELNLEDLNRVEEAEILAAEMPEAPADMGAAMAVAFGMAQDQEPAQDQDAVQDLNQDQDAAQEPETRTFKEILDDVTPEQTTTMLANLAHEWSLRAQYENEKNPDNANIQKTLSKEIKAFSAYGVAQQMVAAGLGAGFMNQSVVSGARRNIYAPEKVRDILSCAASGHALRNKINIAIVYSLYRLNEVQIPFTNEIAKGCASDKRFMPQHCTPYVRRHTVAESTATTQTSSTMAALEALGIVKEVSGAAVQTWQLMDTPLAKALGEAVMRNHRPIAA